MGHSSLVGTDMAPQRAKGTDEGALGRSDNSDSGSDMMGADRLPTADPGEPVDVTLNRDQAIAQIEGTGEDSGETDASDIAVDRIVNLGSEAQSLDDIDDIDGLADMGEGDDEADDSLPTIGKQRAPAARRSPR